MSGRHFKEFYTPYTAQLSNRITAFLASRPGSMFINCEGILAGAERILEKICFRTLLVEFQVCEKSGKLTGNTMVEKVRYYQKTYLSDEAYRRSIFDIYPELESNCQRALEQQGTLAEEMLTRLFRDKEQIEKDILDGRPIEEIEEIRYGQGDPHCGGRGVIELCLKGGESIFYKPRSISADKVFYGLLDEIEEQLGGGKNAYGRILRRIDQKEYGWVKRVSHIDCGGGLRNFYRRIGIQLGISYVLGSHDFHYENLIAHGEYPVLIDLENIFQTGRHIFHIGKGEQMTHSVLSSNLLPATMQENCFAAVTGGRGDEFLYQLPRVYLDDEKFCIIYEKPDMKKGENLPAGEVDAASYLEDILEGFRVSYQHLSRKKGEQLAALLEHGMRSRYLLRGTQMYHSILEASYHPSLLMKKGEREKFIRRMCVSGEGREYEIQDLMNGDIPYFYRFTDDTSLMTASGGRISDFFQETVQEAVRERCSELNENDLALQCEMIRLSVKLPGLNKKELENGLYEWEETGEERSRGWFELAEEMAETLARKAQWNEEHTRVMWLGFKCSAQGEINVGIRNPDFYLYEGIAGIAVFLRAMERAYAKGGEDGRTADHRPTVPGEAGRKAAYAMLCQAAEQDLFEYTDGILAGKRQTESAYTGVFCGEASIIYAYQLLYCMTGEEKYLSYAAKHTEITMKLVPEDANFDLVYGNAGVILALCNMYDLTSEKKYLNYAQKTEEVLREHRQEDGARIWWYGCGIKEKNAGMAHGTSGFLAAYARLSKYLPEAPGYQRILAGLMEYEKAEPVQENSLPCWCRGGLGRLLARLELPKDSALLDEPLLKQGNAIVKETRLRRSMCLCHGNIGNLLTAKRCTKEWGLDPRNAEKLERTVNRLISEKGIIMLSERDSLGLMAGISGIGYGCLMLSGKLPLADIQAVGLVQKAPAPEKQEVCQVPEKQ